jgi:hypothetical protein
VSHNKLGVVVEVEEQLNKCHHTIEHTFLDFVAEDPSSGLEVAKFPCDVAYKITETF